MKNVKKNTAIPLNQKSTEAVKLLKVGLYKQEHPEQSSVSCNDWNTISHGDLQDAMKNDEAYWLKMAEKLLMLSYESKLTQTKHLWGKPSLQNTIVSTGQLKPFPTASSSPLLTSNLADKALQGNADAQCNLAICYQYGLDIEQDAAQAVTWYKRAAKQDHIIAHYQLAICYRKGLGVTQDLPTAERYAKTADLTLADLKQQTDQATLGDYPLALHSLEQAANRGNASAQHNLGNCYYDGLGVTQNYKTAFHWFKKAAEQGLSDAQYNLGICYYRGEGVTKNYITVVHWFKKAAEQGYADAQNNLGICYHYGKGVTQNYKIAAQWYQKAADQGCAHAQYNLGMCYEYGKGVIQNNETAIDWHQKAADQGHREAQEALHRLQPSNSLRM